ncbi:hypothetical protein Ae406Ps2_6413c [Pseudonocardia sp. Ae406_Ps2]|nr:hypothetical protein Ae406Ps2_6413c [Pseudonocardia sp. Ae406_Ps2]
MEEVAVAAINHPLAQTVRTPPDPGKPQVNTDIGDCRGGIVGGTGKNSSTHHWMHARAQGSMAHSQSPSLKGRLVRPHPEFHLGVMAAAPPGGGVAYPGRHAPGGPVKPPPPTRLAATSSPRIRSRTVTKW